MSPCPSGGSASLPPQKYISDVSSFLYGEKKADWKAAAPQCSDLEDRVEADWVQGQSMCALATARLHRMHFNGDQV